MRGQHLGSTQGLASPFILKRQRKDSQKGSHGKRATGCQQGPWSTPDRNMVPKQGGGGSMTIPLSSSDPFSPGWQNPLKAMRMQALEIRWHENRMIESTLSRPRTSTLLLTPHPTPGFISVHSAPLLPASLGLLSGSRTYQAVSTLAQADLSIWDILPLSSLHPLKIKCHFSRETLLGPCPYPI